MDPAKFVRPVAIAFTTLIVLAVTLGVARIWDLLWLYPGIRDYLLDQFGMSKAFAGLLAGLLTLALHLGQGTVLAWLLLGKHKARIAAAGVGLLFAHFGLALIFTPNFGALTGETLRCFSRDEDGKIVLFDHCGTDPVRGVRLEPLTSEIAREYVLQERKIQPRRLEVNAVEGVTFFDPNSSTQRAIVYYSDTSGAIVLYDRSGTDPVSGARLKPITPQIVERLRLQLAADRQKAVMEEQRRSQVADEKRKREEEVELAKRRSNEEIERERVKAVLELEQQRARIEAERLRMEESRRPPMVRRFYAAEGSCDNEPTGTVRRPGWYVCANFSPAPAREYRGYLSIEGEKDLFGNQASGSDGFTISSGDTWMRVGPWSGLRNGAYTLRLIVENAEIARMQLQVR